MSEVKVRKATPEELAALDAKLGPVKRDKATMRRVARLKTSAETGTKNYKHADKVW